MQPQLFIAVCSHLMPEMKHILKKDIFPDVKLIGYPAHCTNNRHTVTPFIEKVSKKPDSFSKLILITSSCFNKTSLHADPSGKIEIHTLDQCFEIFLNIEILQHYIRQGYYLVTNGWLRSYRSHIREWGFDPASAKSFFRESMKKILLLDTGLRGDYMPDLLSLADYMGLPYEVLPIGLSHASKYLNALVSEWRADIAHNMMNDKISALAMESADYRVVFDQLSVFVDLKQEVRIVQEVFGLLMTLFAPEEITYLQYKKEAEIQKLSSANKPAVHNKEENKSFSIKILYQGELLGIFDIINVRFPEYIEKYQKLGKVIRHICSLAIANARKYEIMEEQKEQLSASNQSKDKFFSILAHDLRSPLYAFLGLTEILAKNLDSFTPEDLQDYIQSLNKSAINLNRLLENLLEWSKVNRGIMEFHQEKQPLLEVVLQAISMYRESAARKSIRIHYHIPENISVFIDNKMVETIFRNLISNAIKFTPRQGTITLMAKKTKGKKVLVCLSDTGIGMNEEMQDNLFKPEAKINRLGTEDEPSTGLGLLLCHEFVRMHGGEFWVESKENHGSTFFFTLPS